MSVTAEEIKKLIEQEGDFGHEMRVGHALESMPVDKNEFEPTWLSPIAHGETYIDSITGKPRQFDYRFKIFHYESPETDSRLHCFHIAIECKNLHTASPLVVCGRPRNDREAKHQIIDSESRNVFTAPPIRFGKNLYQKNEFVGKSLLRVRKDGTQKLKVEFDSDLYDKWSQALQSSVDLVHDAVYLSHRNNSRPACSIVLPMVVVPNGSLWRTEYRPDGFVSGMPEQVEHSEFFVGKEILTDKPIGSVDKVVLTHIHFVTLTGLTKFLSRFLKGGNVWAEWAGAFESP